MIPKRIANATHVFGPPADWDDERDGTCSKLVVRIAGETIMSAWEPTPAELALLNAGGSVVLHIWGALQPVALTVEPLADA